jgi:hypothetical protein
MHLVFENTITNLILLWTGQFKGLNQGTGDYELVPDVWQAIGEATANAGSTIPSTYTARPQNIALDKAAVTADARSFWAQYIGPVLLRGRFRKRMYYDHFLKLVKLIQLCLQFEITKEELEEIQTGFIEWVETYEKPVILFWRCKIRADLSEKDFIINTPPIARLHALQQCMHFSILRRVSRPVGLSGHIGHL